MFSGGLKGEKEDFCLPVEDVRIEEAKWVMGVKEGTCHEHWMLYGYDESLNSAPETNVTLYVHQLELK